MKISDRFLLVFAGTLSRAIHTYICYDDTGLMGQIWHVGHYPIFVARILHGFVGETSDLGNGSAGNLQGFVRIYETLEVDLQRFMGDSWDLGNGFNTCVALFYELPFNCMCGLTFFSFEVSDFLFHWPKWALLVTTQHKQRDQLDLHVNVVERPCWSRK